VKDNRIIIGSRGSRLALWQAEHIKERLAALRPQFEIRIEIIKTSGDVVQDVPLAVIGGQGVFTKEIETALLEKRIDLAVHSLKDLPTIVREELTIAAVTEREDARDALVLRADLQTEDASITGLPRGSVVGTSSQRRIAQLKNLRPDLTIKDLRGNVDTRLRKLDEGQYDAIILAAAGLRRLGFTNRISALISIEEMLPAVSQGALGLETRGDDVETQTIVHALNDAPTEIACRAERAFLRMLGGGCQVPIAAHAVVHENRLTLHGLVAAPSGEKILRDAIETDAREAERAGASLAARLIERGADEILKIGN
jgi:hydroxymethylbilane synthase